MSSSMDPDLCRLLLEGKEGISTSPQQDPACPPASPLARWPAAHGCAQAGPGIAPASPRHCPGSTYPLEEVLGSVLLMPVLEGFRS